MALLLIREKLPTKWLIEWEIIKITVWTFMVSELIQYLQNFGPIKRFQFTKVTFVSWKESFRETRQYQVSRQGLRNGTLIYVWNIFPRKTAGTNFSDNSILFEIFQCNELKMICLSRVSLTFQATAFQYFWSIELNPISLHSSLNTVCIHWSVSRRNSDVKFSVGKAYSSTIIWACSISHKLP